jgi:hypothetical protein
LSKSHLVGGPIVGGPLDGTKIMAYGGPAMPALDRTGKRVGTYVWDDETGTWEFDSYGESTSPSLYGEDEE